MNNNSEWIENALTKLYETSEYRNTIMTEFYRTQPLPFIKNNFQFITICFGRNVIGEILFREPVAPHLKVVISYPNIDITWSGISNDEFKVDKETFKLLDDPIEFKKAQELLPQRKALINKYYEALSELLSTKWLLNDSLYIQNEQRELAREIDSLLDKIKEPLLLWYYNQAGQELKSWIESRL